MLERCERQGSRRKKICVRGISTAFALFIHTFSTPRVFRRPIAAPRGGTMPPPPHMSAVRAFVAAALICLAVPSAAGAAFDAMLLRLFLTDGSSVVSYGEFARVDDRVIFSLVTGGSPEHPRLQAVTLSARTIDWVRTDRHAASARYQRYAQARGEEDYTRLSDDVAALLNEVLLAADRGKALAVAEQARALLTAWPRDHFGYRQADVQEIVAVVDEAIAGLRATAGVRSFDVTLVADAPPVALEELAVLPSPREQVDQIFRVAALTERPSERIALLQSAVMLLNEDSGAWISSTHASALRLIAETEIRREIAVDARYTRMAQRVMTEASRAAARARIAVVERLLAWIPREDARLGGHRPEIVEALRASVQAELHAARQLRLLRDRWTIRRSLYQEYQGSSQLLQLVKAQPALEAIRAFEGPPPATLVTLRGRLRGGAERLSRIRPVADLQPLHDLLVGAWRFAESAVDARYGAAQSADVQAAGEASSAAAGALMLLSRAQQEVRELLDPPQLR